MPKWTLWHALPRAACEGMVVHRGPAQQRDVGPAAHRQCGDAKAHFYVRNHFRVPAIDAGTRSLEVTGLVERRLMLSLSDLDRLPSETLVVTLEGAGNGRRFLTPAVDGEPWGLGAVSTAERTAVPLDVALDRTEVLPTATDVVFHDANHGSVPGQFHLLRTRTIRPRARDGDVLLAYGTGLDAGHAGRVQSAFLFRQPARSSSPNMIALLLALSASRLR